jgi:hypothetical protein
MSIIIIILILFNFTFISFAQSLKVFVYELDEKNEKKPLPGTNLYWKNTQIGTTSDLNGFFEIKKIKANNISELELIVSYIGYKPDTILISSELDSIEIILSVNRELEEVLVLGKSLSKFIDQVDIRTTEVITNKELIKAACCNLSESFTTNATVDVQFQDALTGAKQIQMLGLAGTYSQILFENMPTLKGIGSIFGLSYIPGPWMTSIRISKGTGSVINGYESIAGQVNIDYKKPTDFEKYFFNIYQSSDYKTDLNGNFTVDISENLKTMFLFHSNFTSKSIDSNNDSFRDHPDMKQINLLNRWKYESEFGYESIFGFQILKEDRKGGQIFSTSSNNISNNSRIYDVNINTNRLEIFTKNGFVFDKITSTSIGLILNAQIHKQNSLFGEKTYDALQKSFYSNLLFQTSYIDETHTFISGLSFVFDDYIERIENNKLFRKESRPGIFAEYKYSPFDFISVIPSARVDFHNLYGTFFTPRLHFRWDIDQNTTLRLSGGKGYRSVNIFAENSNYFVSSRKFKIIDKPTYEEGWNYGFNLTKYFTIDKRDLRISIEYYRTDFIKQSVVDIDSDVREVRIYNLNGKSFSNTFQIELDYELFSRLDVFTALRLTDVRTQIGNQLLSKPLDSFLKGLITISYTNIDRDWIFDSSFLINGGGRLPSTFQNPDKYKREEKFKPFVNINIQLTKKIDYFDIYLGVENLSNFKQENPIIAVDDPFGGYFDASLIWGPIGGRKLYAGIRLSI